MGGNNDSSWETYYRLFEKIDGDEDSCISQHELKELIANIKFGNVPLNEDEAVAKVIQELDTSGDTMINQDEFVHRIAKWLHRRY
ncbi:hypothetical protein ACOSP7_030878 [Xanthoceras sorbifolium]